MAVGIGCVCGGGGREGAGEDTGAIFFFFSRALF